MDQPSNDGQMAVWILHGLISALGRHQESLPWDISEELSKVGTADLSPESREALEAACQWVWFSFTKNAPP